MITITMKMMIILIPLFLCLDSLTKCNDDDDCYGGHCHAGSCLCPPIWTGPNCQVLKFKPAQTTSPGLLVKDSSTWGGGAVHVQNDHDDGDTWHMFAAMFTNHCGLNSWWPNSEIVHAKSTAGPDGPYTLTESPVLPTFSHGPKPTWLTNQTELVMVHIGCGDSSTPSMVGCTNGTTPANTTHNGTRSRCNCPGWTGILRANSVLGPWTQLENHSTPGLSVDGGPGAWHTNTGLTNPSFWLLSSELIPTSTWGIAPFKYLRKESAIMLLAYSTSCPKCKLDPNHKHIGLAIGSLGKPFHDLTPDNPIFPWAVEDPCIFYDPDSKYYHIIGHRTSNDGPGAQNIASHAVASSPQGPWKIAPIQPYGRDIVWFSNGTNVTTHVQKRERPQIILDKTGRLVALSNGVRPGNHATPVSPNGFTGDWSYTHVQLFDRTH